MTTNSNLSIWSKVQATDPKYTKEFKRGGGFSGTSINATWLARRATETFGPMGIGWGVNILDESLMEGAGGDKIHRVKIELWYMLDGVRGRIEHFGLTTFVGKNKSGTFTDEEAAKKSLTDAMTKALSLLGFASDVHLGLYDDNKYVNAVGVHFEKQQEKEREEKKAARESGVTVTSGSQNSGTAGIERGEVVAGDSSSDGQSDPSADGDARKIDDNTPNNLADGNSRGNPSQRAKANPGASSGRDNASEDSEASSGGSDGTRGSTSDPQPTDTQDDPFNNLTAEQMDIIRKIDEATDIPGITDLMMSPEVQLILKSSSKVDQVVIRSHATVKLRKFGWPKAGRAKPDELNQVKGDKVD